MSDPIAHASLDNSKVVQYFVQDRTGGYVGKLPGPPLLCNTKGCRRPRFARISCGTSEALDIGLCRVCTEAICRDLLRTLFPDPDLPISLTEIADIVLREVHRQAREEKMARVSPLFR